MTCQDACRRIDAALDTLAREMENGITDAMKRYLATMARFHRYSWGNQLLIAVQRPDATRVAGYNTWRTLGRYVRKGEHGIAILAPCGGRKHETPDDEPDTSPDIHPARVTSFRAVYVFDVSQTDGDPLPAPNRVEGEAADLLARLIAFTRNDLGIELTFVNSLGAAQGVSYGGRIEVKDGLPAAEAFSVLCHEIAHSLLHFGVPKDVREDKTLVETQAEAVAFVVCHALGLKTNGAAADYIQLYRGNRETLRQSLSAIHAAAGRILGAIGHPEE